MIRVAADRRAHRFRGGGPGCGAVARLQRDACGFRSAIRDAQTSIANKNLPDTAVGRSARRVRRENRRGTMSRLAWRDGKEGDEPSRGADGGEDAFGAEEGAVWIRGDDLSRRRTGAGDAEAG